MYQLRIPWQASLALGTIRSYMLNPMRRILFAILLLLSSYSVVKGQGATLFEGARLITGDGSAPIENSAFLVENTQFKQVGRRGQIPLRPAPPAST